jgi:hypothetical protein
MHVLPLPVSERTAVATTTPRDGIVQLYSDYIRSVTHFLESQQVRQSTLRRCRRPPREIDLRPMSWERPLCKYRTS